MHSFPKQNCKKILTENGIRLSIYSALHYCTGDWFLQTYRQFTNTCNIGYWFIHSVSKHRNVINNAHEVFLVNFVSAFVSPECPRNQPFLLRFLWRYVTLDSGDIEVDWLIGHWLMTVDVNTGSFVECVLPEGHRLRRRRRLHHHLMRCHPLIWSEGRWSEWELQSSVTQWLFQPIERSRDRWRH